MFFWEFLVTMKIRLVWPGTRGNVIMESSTSAAIASVGNAQIIIFSLTAFFIAEYEVNTPPVFGMNPAALHKLVI